MKYRVALILCVAFCISSSNLAHSQVQLISPLPNGIVQKVSDSAYVRILLASNTSTRIVLTIRDSLQQGVPYFTSIDFTFINNSLDTLLRIPFLKKFSILWQTSDGIIDSGIIANLTCGHVFGIVGQSNAQGWSPPPFISPHGDIRMLRNDSAWQAGEDPTGGMYASPWIGFSNKLQELLKDSLPIGLVNAAIGGTGLVYKTANGWWERNDALHTDTSSVYGQALTKFINAGSRFEALFWIQGESDAVGVLGVVYDSAFKKLVLNFQEDLHGPVKFFHLQIGGQIANPDKTHWGIIRDAQRNLPLSILVGTAVGSPVGFDGIHYAPITEIMVGDKFAGAIAKEIYNIPTNLFSPLIPQYTASLIQCSANDPYKGYKIVLQCLTNGSPAILRQLDTLRSFQIRVNGQLVDTSGIFARVEPNDLSKIDIYLKDSSLSLNDELALSYAITGDISNANVSDNDTSTSLPNYLVSFMDIPVLPTNDVAPSLSMPGIIPNPFSDRYSFNLILNEPAVVSYTLFTIDGKMVYSRSLGELPEGKHSIQINRGSVSAGTYEIVFRIGTELKTFKIIIL